jgi:hypothetical protein
MNGCPPVGEAATRPPATTTRAPGRADGDVRLPSAVDNKKWAVARILDEIERTIVSARSSSRSPDRFASCSKNSGTLRAWRRFRSSLRSARASRLPWQQPRSSTGDALVRSQPHSPIACQGNERDDRMRPRSSAAPCRRTHTTLTWAAPFATTLKIRRNCAETSWVWIFGPIDSSMMSSVRLHGEHANSPGP